MIRCGKTVRRLVLLGLALTMTLVSCGEKKPAAAAKDAAGEVSGKLVIYTSMYEDIIEKMTQTLNTRFPKAEIKFFYGGTGTLQAKIAAEMNAGKLGCDMMMLAEPSYSLELKEAGILHKYVSPARDRLAFEYDSEGYWYPVRVLNMVLAYNPDKYSLGDIPHTMQGLAHDPRLKGFISMPNPLTAGSALAAISALRDKYGYEYYTALGNQKVMVESGSVALTKLETGECKVIMILEESVLKKREEEKSKLTVIYPDDGSVLIPSTIMTVKGEKSANNNTRAAEIVTDWFLSEEGQAAIVGGWMHSVLKNYDKLPYDAIPTAKILAASMPVNWEKTFRQREEMRKKFEDNVTIKKAK